jgi:hypothetical protein
MAGMLVVENYTNVMRAFAKADRDIRLGWRTEMRRVAEPVRVQAEQLAVATIPRMARSPKWARMRTGVTQKEVYIVPRQRGVRGRNPKSRPNLADLMMNRAMQPALDRNRGNIIRGFEQALDRMAAEFNRSGNA